METVGVSKNWLRILLAPSPFQNLIAAEQESEATVACAINFSKPQQFTIRHYPLIEHVIGHKLQFWAANGLIGPTIGPILKVFATLQSQYDFTVSATLQNL